MQEIHGFNFSQIELLENTAMARCCLNALYIWCTLIGELCTFRKQEVRISFEVIRHHPSFTLWIKMHSYSTSTLFWHFLNKMQKLLN